MSYAPPTSYVPMPPFGVSADPSGIGPVDPNDPSVAPVPVGDAQKVEKKILEFLDKCLTNGVSQTQQLQQWCDQTERLYLGTNQNIVLPTDPNTANLGQTVELKDCADQIDSLSGLLFEQAVPASTPPFNVNARGGETTERAACLRSAMMYELEMSQSELAIEMSVQFYCKYPLGGLEFKRWQIDVPMKDEQTMPIAQAQAFMSVHESMGHDVVQKGPGQMPGEVEMCATWTARQNRFSFVNMDIRKYRFSDMRRPIPEQHCMQKANYWTREEMESFGFDVSELGDPNSGGRHRPTPNTSEMISTTAPMNTGPFNTHEIWENTARIPWQTWIESGDINQLDLQVFAEKRRLSPAEGDYGFKTGDFAPGVYNKFFHKSSQGLPSPGASPGNGAVLLAASPNPLCAQPKTMPMWGASFTPPDADAVGRNLAQRQSEMNAAANLSFNNWQDNLRRRGRKSFFVGGNFPGGKDKYAQIHVPGAAVISPGGMDPREAIFPWEVEDITDSTLKALAFMQSDVRDKGVNSAMQGESNVDTATEASINANKGAVKITSAFRRWMRHVYAPALRALAVEVALSYKYEDYIRVCGETGAAMKGVDYRSADEVLTKFEIAPVATFDFALKLRKMQSITQIANIFGPFLSPPEIRSLLSLALRSSDFTEQEVQEIQGSAGTITDVFDEIKAMLADPSVQPVVRPDDNHLMVMQVAQQIEASSPQIAAQLESQPNYQRWKAEHMAGLQAMVAQAQLDHPAPAPPGQNGKRDAQPPPKNGSSPKTPEQTNTRQMAQLASPPDMGMDTNSGMTGRAVPGSPAGV